MFVNMYIITDVVTKTPLRWAINYVLFNCGINDYIFLCIYIVGCDDIKNSIIA